MNHIGDTNKMVDTPRTDELLTAMLDVYGYVHQGNCPQQWVNYARELERELIATIQRIKRLEEALTKIELAMKQPASNHRLMQIAGPARQVINIIKKAKEDKL